MLTGSSFWVTGQVTACVHQMGRLYRHQGSLQSTGCMIDTRSHVKCHTCALPWTLSQSIDRPSTSLREEAGSSGNLTAGGKDKEGGGETAGRQQREWFRLRGGVLLRHVRGRGGAWGVGGRRIEGCNAGFKAGSYSCRYYAVMCAQILCPISGEGRTLRSSLAQLVRLQGVRMEF